jgi:PAS domain S-box-containing protein
VKEEDHAKEQLLKEVFALRQRITDLEASVLYGKDSKSALQAAHQEWEQSFNALTDDVCILDRSGMILKANKAMRDRFERLHGSLVGLDYRLVYYGTTAPCPNPPWMAVLSGALSVAAETWLPKLEGWFLVSCYPLHDACGKQWGAISIVKDITERKRVEEALRDMAQRAPAAGSVAFLRSLVKHLAKALDVDYTYLAELTGDAQEEVQTVAVCVHGEMSENFAFHLSETPGANVVRGEQWCFASGVRQQFPNDRLLLEWGVESYIGVPLFHSSGRPVGLVVAMDSEPLLNTQFAESILGVFAVRAAAELERKRAEEALRDSEERYRAIAENTHDLICETSSTGRFLYLSPNYRDVLGYEPRELLGRSVHEHVHPDDCPAVKGEFERGMRTLRPGQAVFRYRHRNGEWRWFESTGKAFWTTTGEIRGVVVSRDITERKKMEEERLRASKHESVSLLAGGIAHDFNNILTAIVGNISLAKMSVDPGEDLFKRLTEAEKASLRAKGLTQQLLTFAKGGAPVKKLTSIADLLKESASFGLRGSNVNCQFDLPDGLCLADIDEGQISQVINNLVINAKQAMPEGGTITVRAQNIVVRAGAAEPSPPLPEGKYVKISINDRGTGIPEDLLPKIFDPYFTTKQQGSGLGLATSYSIIRNHGGHIAVESELGAGTTFSFHLPASPRNLLPAKEVEERPQVGRGKILVMDDEEAIRDLLVQMLTRCGYEADVARFGAEAIELYKQAYDAGRPYAAVIMDLTIPGGMGGKEAIKKLVAVDPDVKVVVSSGYANDPVMANYRQYNFRGACPKPYKVTELSGVLHRAINGEA